MGKLKVNGDIEVGKILGSDTESGLVIQSKSSTTKGWGEGVYIVPHSNGFATLTLGPTDRTSGCALVYHKDTSSHYLEVKTNNGNSFQSTIPYTNGVLLNSGNYTSYTVTKTGGGASGTWGINVTGNATTSSIPLGFSYREASWAWGTLTAANGYTLLTDWITPGSGGLAFADKGSQVSCQIDGYFYQDEGRYMVLDTNNYTTYAPTKTGSGASGTWNISINGNAHNANYLDGYDSTSFAMASHNHTSLTGITSLDFAANKDDGASIRTTVSDTTTYFDFNLLDDGDQDKFRWIFGRWDSTTSSQTNVTLMTLTSAQNTNTAKLVVNGTIQGNLDWSYITNKPSTFTPSSHSHSYLPLSGGSMSGDIVIGSNFITGETGTSGAKCHGLQLGYPSHDYWTFTEWGGLYHFYKYQTSGSTVTVNTLCGSINEYGWVQGSGGYGSTFPASPAIGQIFYKT